MEKSSDVDLLTETDQEVEKLLMDGIRKSFPNHRWNTDKLDHQILIPFFYSKRFIGEEETSEGKKAELTDSPTWIIDPVDGTMNFVHNFPHSCVSIALLVNKIAEIAIIYNPVLKQKFTARRGKGAFLNDQAISVSGQKDIGKVLVTTEFGTTRDSKKIDVTIENMDKMVRKVHG